MNEYKVSLGIDFNDGELKDIKKQLTNLTDNTHRIRIDIDDSRLLKQIDHAKKELKELNSTKKNQPSLTVNTKSLEQSLEKVAGIIGEVKVALGTLDKKSGMNNLLSSVNQIATAISKVTDESETLVKTLSALSKKDFNFNLDFKIGGSNSIANNAAYGNKVRNETLPELKKQAEALGNYIKEYYKVSHEYMAILELAKKSGDFKIGGEVQDLFTVMGGYSAKGNGKASLSEQMGAYKRYINIIKELSSANNIDLSHVTSGFSKSADSLIKDAQDIQTGAKETEEQIEKLKQVFSSGIDADNLSKVLEPIVVDLGEIKKAIDGLSKNASLSELTKSFNELSRVLKELMDNYTLVQKTLDASSFGNSDVNNTLNKAEQASNSSTAVVVENEEKKQQAYKETARVAEKVDQRLNKPVIDVDDFAGNAIKKTTDQIENLEIALKRLGFNDSSIEEIIKDFKNLEVAVNKVKTTLKGDTLSISANGTDQNNRKVQVSGSFTPDKEGNLKSGGFSTSVTQYFRGNEDFFKEINEEMADFVKLQEQISKKEVEIGKLKLAGGSENEIAELNKQLENLENTYDKLMLKFSKKLFDNASIMPMEDISKFDDEIIAVTENAENKLRQLSARAADKSTADTVKQLNKEMADFVRLQKQISQKEIEIGKLEAVDGKTNQIAELKRQLEELEKVYSDLMHTFMKKLTANADIMPMDDVNKFDDEIIAVTERAENKLKELDAKVADTKAKLANGIKLKLNNGTFDNDISDVNSKFDKLSIQSKETKIAIDRLNDEFNNMKLASARGDIEALISASERYEQVLKDVNNQLKISARNERDAAATQKLNDNIATFKSDVDAWLTKNSAAANKFEAELRNLQKQAESCDRATLNHLENEFKRIDKAAEAAGLKTQTFGDKIKAQFTKYSAYFSVAELFMYVEQGLKDMFEQVKAIDTAMTELKKVTDESDASYNQFLNKAALRSKELGTTIDGLVESTADFARLGYGFEESQGLAEVANIYAVVGDEIEGVEDATQSLVSTLAAFRDEMGNMSDTDFAMGIVDKMNEVSNNFAISSGGIGEALQRSASSMAAANNTLDETIAMITAANEVAQNPEKVGNAMKTMSMRIRGAKTELEEAGESTDGMAESTASLRQEMLALSGVDIMLND